MADKSEEVAHLQEEHSEQGIADATEQVNVDLPNDCHSPPPAYSAAEVKVKVNDNEGGENDVNGGDGGDSGHQTLVTKPPITSTSAFYIKKWILLTMISLTILLLLLTIFLAELILPAIDAESCQTNTEDCSMETDKDNKDFRLAARTFLFLLLKLHVFFLWGVARHRLCPSTTYTVLNVLVSFGLGFACVAMPTTSMFRNALVAAALTAVAYSYTKDLRKNMRDSCTTVVLRRLDAVNVNVSEGENGGSRQAVLHPKPPPPATAFLVKKWILLVAMTIGFLCLLIVLLAMGYILERVPSPSPEEDNDDAYCQLVGCSKAKVDIKKAFKIVLCAILLLALLLQGLFIWGVARQHLGLCVGYTVLCVLTTCSMLISSLDDPAAKLLRAPVPLLLTYVAYSYTNDLRIMRNNRLQRGLAVV